MLGLDIQHASMLTVSRNKLGLHACCLTYLHVEIALLVIYVSFIWHYFSHPLMVGQCHQRF